MPFRRPESVMDHQRPTLSFCLIFGTVLWLNWCANVGVADDSEKSQFFETRIRPVLVRHCYECHSVLAKEPKGELRLDSRAGIRKGGESGPAVVPGKVAESLLIDAIRHDSLEMPPNKKLPETVIADFVKWIEMGAADPRDAPPNPKEIAELAWEELFQERRRWWSLQPVVAPPMPVVKDRSWSNHPIDQLILAKLEANGLRPAPHADRRTLARRLSYALLGLPPSPDEVDQFVRDTSPAAYERLVDRFLASPHFGERLARHWMDVVRYSDTYGYEWDIPAKGAWRYRDYLTRALNADVPFDQIVREHIAGDLLETPRINPIDQINESLTGVMFYQMGENRHGDSAEFNGIHQEMLDNKIDAFSKAFQATTIACARCHDHKLDPITQREYYALGGLFMSSRWVVNTLDTPERNAKRIRRLNEIKSELRRRLAETWLLELRSLPAAMLAAQVSVSSKDAEDKTVDSSKTRGSTVWRKLLTFETGKQPSLEDLRLPWLGIVNAEAEDADVATHWRTLAKQYAEHQKQRREQNARDYVVIADFSKEIPDGWSVDGVGLQHRVECGDFTVALEGTAVVDRLLPGGLFTHVISPRLNGVIRTPYLNRFSKKHISFEYCGGDFSAHRTVVDNAFLTERQGYLNQTDLGWLKLSTFPTMKERRIYIELATKTSNPNFPPRVGLGGQCSEEQARDPRSWFGVTRVLLHDKPAAPADELARFSDLFAGKPPRDLADVAKGYQRWFQNAVEAWSRNQADEDDVRLINWMLANSLLSNQCDMQNLPKIAALVNRYRNLERQLAEPQTACGMADLDAGYDYRLNIRGDYDQLGDEIPRGYLQALSNSTSRFQSRGSGRLQLAEKVASPDNPLTARVFVNRVWHWLFGAGLVTTPNDFGHLGERPSHPELLDYLAGRFVTEGWSVKRLVRSIVLTQTWRQSGRTADKARAVDPKNRLLHHYPLRRLEAEAIRDAILAVSGRLETRLYGPPINPHRQKEDPQKRLFSGPVDGKGRRSIYTKITIMEPPRLLATFNQPEPKIPTGKRDITNTPAQSLALLNDPFVHGQAEYWAKQLVEMDLGVADRLALMFRTAFARNPTHRELERWKDAIADLAELHHVDLSEQAQSLPIWKDVAHLIFNTKEFIYIR